MLQLQFQSKTEQRLKKILAQYDDKELFAQNIINYQIAELRKANLNIILDLRQFEKQYQQSSIEFYQAFNTAKLNDKEDFIIWAGIYEMLLDNQQQLVEIM